MVYTGGLRRSLTIPYVGAEVWGTGINPVHEIYGSNAVRLEPIPGRAGEVTPVTGSVPDSLTPPDLWGYTPEDSRSTGVDYDGRPTWNQQPEEYRGDSDDYPSYNAPGMVREIFRGLHDGAHRYRQKLADALPNETVTEGWRNKPKGTPADALPSSNAQLVVKTSEVQRYEIRNNNQAELRNTDDARAPIESRVTGQRLKVYSGQQRHYDMFPRQQTPILRPFSYRTAGTGPDYYLRSNEFMGMTPVERVPPPDPPMGEPENELTSGYGYTPEDTYYA